ncbi:hypothetical protein VIGAN_06162800, partial [Vigna angularis var. angularis]
TDKRKFVGGGGANGERGKEVGGTLDWNRGVLLPLPSPLAFSTTSFLFYPFLYFFHSYFTLIKILGLILFKISLHEYLFSLSFFPLSLYYFSSLFLTLHVS